MSTETDERVDMTSIEKLSTSALLDLFFSGRTDLTKGFVYEDKAEKEDSFLSTPKECAELTKDELSNLTREESNKAISDIVGRNLSPTSKERRSWDINDGKMNTINFMTQKEAVHHPDHYNKGLMETMEKFLLMFHDRPDFVKGALLFNIMKYTDRAPFKGKEKEDNDKGGFYLDVFETLFEEDAWMLNLYRVGKQNKNN